MLIARRAVLLAALLLPTLAFAADETPYLTAKELDLVRFLPPPVVAGSAEDAADIAAVVAAQKSASPERVALAVHDADETLEVIWAGVLGPRYVAGKLTLTERLFARIGMTEDAVIDPVKPTFGRVRPWIAAPDRVEARVKASKSGSYPSGHTTRAVAEAAVLSAMVPEKRAEIWARVDEYAESRVIGGMHYPRDLAAGRMAGTAIAATLFADPAFRADVEAARVELRTALGY